VPEKIREALEWRKRKDVLGIVAGLAFILNFIYLSYSFDSGLLGFMLGFLSGITYVAIAWLWHDLEACKEFEKEEKIK